ncbi:bifunctional DNA primase/polymerase [Saccharopolyspora sp. 6M]|uniref:bifunctional DNA primase/polymerase n=1 Tax=Saccharopolyspora sp. 6M TaxID=2877237 RepID=UPI001CD50C6B|nr:bifunctional DNA primase/polymerase [Saccharopolyspora sp. 6M]MCA1225047.1 bifunctional DNA primase/polymerase [Saccharopolyspora sp. 6M]
MSTATTQLRAWALCLAELGWHVFPLQPGRKVPALHGLKSCPRTGICAEQHQGWEQRATTDPDRIARCWAETPYNVGLATGRSGLLVVDCDQPGHAHRMPDGWNTLGITTGAGVLASLVRRSGEPWPETYTVATPSGGTHHYFRAPAGFRNTAGTLGPLVDTRAGGGYVVAPGSITPEGFYNLLDDTEPADPPVWLRRAAAPRPSPALSAPREIAPARLSGYVAAAVRAETARVTAAESGRQNRTLYEAALALGRLVAGGAVDDATVRTALHRAMSRLPLTRPHEPWTAEQIDTTVDSAFRAAAHNPRTLTPRGNAA